jgi:3-oxoadipate enol-lactonase
VKATVNGIDVSYEIHGKEGAPWVVFNHSLACSKRMWDPQIERLGGRFRMLVHDMRGHGESSAPAGPYTLELLASDVVALMRHLGIRRAHFVGLSIGGMIGQVLADRHAELFERVVLADTSHTQTPETLKQWDERIRIAQTQGMDALVESTLARWLTEPFRKNQPEATAKIAAQIRATPVAGYVGCSQAIKGLKLTARLKEIRLSVLAIAGENDASAPGTRFIGENIPGAKLVMIPQAAHIANVEQAEKFTAAVAEFLS